MPWSDFLRSSGSGLATVAERDLVLQRRDGPDLLVTEAGREAAARETLGALAGMLTHLVGHGELADVVVGALGDAMPWIKVLPDSEQKQFTAELVETARSASSLGDYEMLSILLSRWSNTAFVHANPALRARLLAEPDMDEIVSRP